MEGRIRRSVVVHGVVQGVGFRPFVYSLARRLELTGFVRNETGGVQIEIEGVRGAVDAFVESLTRPPPLARVDAIECDAREVTGSTSFEIASSAASTGYVQLAPDVATCDDCVRELFDPSDRRYRYPFINCTNCGPRLTIIERAPYDRGGTTMARFAMCEACEAEYRDPTDRRFHAQPNACAACGPTLAIVGAGGEPIAGAVAALRAGMIVALKGLGGYHLACDATNEATVATLRARKHRDEKPFALMVADIAAADRICELSDDEGALLASRERPIVLAKRRGHLAASVAPKNPLVGVMLPYTPLHHLLAAAIDVPLVMTSGNRSDEPIAFEDADALARLRGIADVIVLHDRAIHTRCDDSVVRIVAGSVLPLRRSRGYAPRTVRLPVASTRNILALGGHLKASFAFGTGDRALLGHHIGDLDEHSAYTSYVRAIEHYERVFELSPELVVHDLHPDYASTRYACERGIERIAVQHHHAHVASCAAEHGLTETVIGVAFDGHGYGTDGSLWGGEFLLADLRSFERAAHLREVALPGGERAIREPWRMALAYLHDANRLDAADRLLAEVPADARRFVRNMIDRGVCCPRTSSIGRLFDAVAALAGLRMQTSFEGQAAMELEWRTMAAPHLETSFEGQAAMEWRAMAAPRFETSFEAATEWRAMAAPRLETSLERQAAMEWRAMAAPVEPGYAFDYRAREIDARPVIDAIVDDRLAGIAPERIARRFHGAVIDMVATVCGDLRAVSGIDKVVASGGVFQNAVLVAGVVERLASDGFTVYRHREVPPNDGGLALGQLAIATARSSR